MVTMKTILHPTDVSEPARIARKYAIWLAREFKATLHILYVVEEVRPGQNVPELLAQRGILDCKDNPDEHAPPPQEPRPAPVPRIPLCFRYYRMSRPDFRFCRRLDNQR